MVNSNGGLLLVLYEIYILNGFLVLEELKNG